ncbi:hypothetical protein OAU50_05250 [Planctomycetota bacterium]|nr:hypothetical protein [Planctomycetota bacterium]
MSRLVLAFVVIALVFVATWYAMVDDDRVVLTNAQSEGEILSEATPIDIPNPTLDIPDKPSTQLDEPQKAKATEPVDSQEILFHEPNYGHLLQRGKGVVSFELFDANNKRVNVGETSANLRRILGDFAITDECRIDRNINRIVCDGLSTNGASPVGLEPGEYELTVTSGRWGNHRQRFHVMRGETRIERMQSEHFRRTICFYFADQHGQPVPWINGEPSVSCTSKELLPVSYGVPKDDFLKLPPDKSSDLGMTGWGSSSSRRFRSDRTSYRYATDDGRFYFEVWAGAKNTVRFNLEESFWGTKEVVVTDTFIDSRWELYQVTLTLPDEFTTHVEKLNEYKLKTPGNRPEPTNPAKSKPVKPDYHPETAPIRSGLGRVIISIDGPSTLQPEAMNVYDKYKKKRSCKRAHGIWYFVGKAQDRTQIRAVGGSYQSEWQDVTLQDGQVTYASITANTGTITLNTSALPPTLNAAVNMVELQINSEKIVKRDPDTPHPNLATARKTDSPWNNPPIGTDFLRRYRFARDKNLYGTSLLYNPHRAFVGPEIKWYGYRTVLRTTARRRTRSGAAMYGADGRTPFDPITLKAEWKYVDGDASTLVQSLQNAEISPFITELLALRVVGDNQEGLPWTQGVLLPLEDDSLAQSVRTRMQNTPDGETPNLDAKNLDKISALEYAAGLAGLEDVEDTKEDAALKALIGESNYNAFNTSEQRHWFAKHGSWYDTSAKVFSDEHGYVLTRQHKLDEGEAYVLYLWSQSRDQLKPDKRIVFKATKDNTDLGVIRLPSYQ